MKEWSELNCCNIAYVQCPYLGVVYTHLYLAGTIDSVLIKGASLFQR